jgi:hypothetical protein
MSSEDVASLKATILEGIQSAHRPFLFGQAIIDSLETLRSHHESSAASNALLPFTVCSKSGTDESEMDASLLMSSKYIPPLLESELSHLIKHLFNPEHMKWLRHSAARRYLLWRDHQLSVAVTELADAKLYTAMNPVRRARLQRLAREAPYRGGSQMLIPHQFSTSRSNTLSGHSFSSKLGPKIHINPSILNTISKQDRERWFFDRVHEDLSTMGLAGNKPGDMVVTQVTTQESLSKSSKGRKSRSKHAYGTSELPSWSRQKLDTKLIDTKDPLGLIEAWQTWGRAIICGASGGLVVGVIWVVVYRGWAYDWRLIDVRRI